ncbi:glutamine--fructose-6-phosphate transaminase (isomerizing) [Bombilactobacillus folatiphilus]|uniref:Glutamine--fructose-6-phosphate aminotransferase [isomerizing] n=1 Tax=Bombilactobacillus folatiphilus TaxID=2923362 RepID=A0ABY4PAE6_9LACO|nr:glutamine--fructose-6-phosphate transaminase (isomerizing) [Bombilactobacillus folatiphilus]UQS82491.1 glutamine--fructose-6-phosphate transaminase (isomerizing) [Bombilactobacillus folatiphilus]
MCGIVGVAGNICATTILLDGLEKLEYRGYDSSGIYVTNGENGFLCKRQGKIANLREAVGKKQHGTTGIGHTRWATHGAPSQENAHPQVSDSQRFYLVHNGVITNAEDLKERYLKHITFTSQTDTEVIVQLIAYFVEQKQLTTLRSLQAVISLLEGSYAIAMMDRRIPEQIFIAKNKSPLLIGLGDDANYLCSDALAMLPQTQIFMEIKDGETGIISSNEVKLFDEENKAINRSTYQVKIDANDLSKGAYDSYMLKEIDEQPAVLRRIIQTYTNINGDINMSSELIERLIQSDRLYIVAAGTSYHAGLIGKSLFEQLTDIPVEVVLASEFGYHLPKLSAHPFFLFLSQSGETADSRQVLVKIKKQNYPSLTITNVADSTLSREADYTLLLHAGPEIAVASTKAYTAQIAVESLLAKFLGTAKKIEAARQFDVRQELSLAATGMQSMIDEKDYISKLAKKYFYNQRTAFFIGRGNGYYLSLEAALKLKEVSYLHAEGFAAGELKHGTIALIEQDTPVVAFVTEAKTADHTRSNVQEVLSRGAKVLIISQENLVHPNDQLTFPVISELLNPLVAIIPTQLFAYFTAKARGNNVDQPRNLAKSVTVE